MKRKPDIGVQEETFTGCIESGCMLDIDHTHEPAVAEQYFVEHEGVTYEFVPTKYDTQGNIIEFWLIGDGVERKFYIDEEQNEHEIIIASSEKWYKKKTVVAAGATAVSAFLLSILITSFRADISTADQGGGETTASEAANPSVSPGVTELPSTASEAPATPASTETAPLPAATQSSFVVCSYNVHYKNDKAIPEIMSLLAKCDLLGVQELTRDKEELLAQDQLQPTGEFDANVPLEPNTETATFSKKARFTFEGMAETILLHDQQLLDEHFPKQNNPNKIKVHNVTRKSDVSNIGQKTMSIMKIIDNTNNRKYAFVSLHMEYGIQNDGALESKEKDRMNIYYHEVGRVSEKISELEALGYDVIKVGDTNWHSSGDENSRVLDNMLRSKGDMSSDDTSVLNQTPNENYSHDKTKRLIDKIFAPRTGFVMTYRWTDEGQWESDHDPVGAGLMPNP